LIRKIESKNLKFLAKIGTIIFWIINNYCCTVSLMETKYKDDMIILVKNDKKDVRCTFWLELVVTVITRN